MCAKGRVYMLYMCVYVGAYTLCVYVCVCVRACVCVCVYRYGSVM